MTNSCEGMLPILGSVLIVEDDPILRTLMRYILADMGAVPITYSSADDALDYLLQSHAHCPLVIVDQCLPGEIQGAEFLNMVRGKWPSVRTILTSAHPLEPAMFSNRTVYLDKPWTPQQFETTVATVLHLFPHRPRW